MTITELFDNARGATAGADLCVKKFDALHVEGVKRAGLLIATCHHAAPQYGPWVARLYIAADARLLVSPPPTGFIGYDDSAPAALAKVEAAVRRWAGQDAAATLAAPKDKAATLAAPTNKVAP